MPSRRISALTAPFSVHASASPRMRIFSLVEKRRRVAFAETSVDFDITFITLEDRRRIAGFCKEVTILEPHPITVDISRVSRARRRGHPRGRLDGYETGCTAAARTSPTTRCTDSQRQDVAGERPSS